MAYANFQKALNDADEIELTTTGRTSGRESSRPVWFIQQGENVYLLPVTDPTKVDEVVESFRSKYGAADFAAYYPKHDVAVEIPPA